MEMRSPLSVSKEVDHRRIRRGPYGVAGRASGRSRNGQTSPAIMRSNVDCRSGSSHMYDEFAIFKIDVHTMRIGRNCQPAKRLRRTQQRCDACAACVRVMLHCPRAVAATDVQTKCRRQCAARQRSGLASRNAAIREMLASREEPVLYFAMLLSARIPNGATIAAMNVACPTCDGPTG